MKNHLENGLRLRNDKKERLLVPKRLSDTRWSCRADAIRSLKAGYRSFISALNELHDDEDEKMVWLFDIIVNIFTKLQFYRLCE